MRSMKLGWVILFGMVSMLLGGGYYLYSRQSLRFEQHAANIREIKRLHDQQAKLMQIPDKIEEEAEVIKLLAAKQGELWFMEDIEEHLGAKVSPSFLLIGPMKREDKINHLRFSRQISLESSFPELLTLLDILEKKRGFTVSQLQIGLSADKPNRHQISFLLSCIQIKESFISQLGIESPPSYREDPVVVSLLLDASWKPGEKLALGPKSFDPFVKLKRNKPSLVKKRAKRYAKKYNIKKKKTVLPPKDLTGKYTLQGIVKVAGTQIALIAPDYVLEPGDWLDDKQIIEITAEKVILQKGKRKYFIRLPGTNDEENKKIRKQKKASRTEIQDKKMAANRPNELAVLSIASAQGERRVAAQ